MKIMSTDISARNTGVRSVSLRKRSDRSAPSLSVDTRHLGDPIPLSELSEGDFVVAVGPTEIAAGIISSMARENGKLRLVLMAHNSMRESYMLPPLTSIDNAEAVYRIDPIQATREPTRFERIFKGYRADVYPLAPTVSEIFGQELPFERIGIEDQGKAIIVPFDDDQRWSIHTITSVEGSGSSFRATFDTNYSSTRSQNLRALIFR